MFTRELPDAADYIEGVLLPDLHLFKVQGYDKVELTVMAHGAGSQTSALLLLASHSYKFKKRAPGHLELDLALFASVGDQGTECEWPETMRYLLFSHWFSYVTVARVDPSMWNGSLKGDERGMYDRYLDRKTMPFRMFRSCTDHFKVRPQTEALKYLHDEAAQFGVDVKIRQVIGYSADEEHRAKKFVSSAEWIRPYFPLIEWGWTREDTIKNLKKMLPQTIYSLGLPEKSGCWMCPFQPRGKIDPVTLEIQPRSWRRLQADHPDLHEKAAVMEDVQNERREGFHHPGH